MAKNSGGSSKSERGFLGFFSRLFSDLFGGSNLNREKRRQLRDIAKELNKRSRIYRVKGDLALPGMAKWFYDIYKAIGPAGVLLEKYGSSELLKTVMIESFLPSDVRPMIGDLTPDNIKNKAERGADIKVVAEEVKGNLLRLHSALDPATVKKINKMYNDFHRFQSFCRYPYHFMLKKFDSALPDRNFSYKPQFDAINAQYVKDDIGDFLELLYALDLDAEWNLLFDVLKSYRDMDVISRTSWKKVIQSHREMIKSRTLELVVQHLEENPAWAPIPNKANYEVVDAYLSKVKTGAELTIQEILRSRKRQQIEKILMKLFGTTSINRTQHYTERENLTFHKKMLAGYTCVEALNHLKTFYLDFYKSKVRVLVDLLIIQGKWSTRLSSQHFSDVYHQLLSLSDQLLAFDADLSNEGQKGAKIRQLLRQSARERSALSTLKVVLQDVNAEAKRIINVSAQNFIVLGKFFKQLLDQYKARNQEIIINWKEIESSAQTPLVEWITDIYTQIYYLVQILQLQMKETK